MSEKHTIESLRAFEERVAAAFDHKEIPYPVHLSSGNEEQLIQYFAERYRPGDWIFGSWRAHLHALLAGVPENELFSAILAGRSIALNFPAYHVHCSAIVAGQIPMALGAAMGIRASFEKKLTAELMIEFKLGELAYNENGLRRVEYAIERALDDGMMPQVHCFVGDMCAETGTFHEASKYARNFSLPITFVVEDNGISVCTPTREAWGSALISAPQGDGSRGLSLKGSHIVRYCYENPWPHSGGSARTSF